MNNQKGDTLFVVMIFILFALIILGCIGFIQIQNKPCSELGNLTIQSLPARCLPNYPIK
jgi:hypothetical protein